MTSRAYEIGSDSRLPTIDAKVTIHNRMCPKNYSAWSSSVRAPIRMRTCVRPFIRMSVRFRRQSILWSGCVCRMRQKRPHSHAIIRTLAVRHIVVFYIVYSNWSYRIDVEVYVRIYTKKFECTIALNEKAPHALTERRTQKPEDNPIRVTGEQHSVAAVAI